MCNFCTGVLEDQKRVSDSLKLEFQMVVSYPTWMLRTEPGTLKRILALNQQAISSVPGMKILKTGLERQLYC